MSADRRESVSVWADPFAAAAEDALRRQGAARASRHIRREVEWVLDHFDLPEDPMATDEDLERYGVIHETIEAIREMLDGRCVFGDADA